MREHLSNEQRVKNWLTKQYREHGLIQHTTSEIRDGVNKDQGMKKLTATQVNSVITALKRKGELIIVGEAQRIPGQTGRIGKYWALQKVLDMATSPNTEEDNKQVIKGEIVAKQSNQVKDNEATLKNGDPVGQLMHLLNSMRAISDRLGDIESGLTLAHKDYNNAARVYNNANERYVELNDKVTEIQSTMRAVAESIGEAFSKIADLNKSDTEFYMTAFKDGMKFAIQEGLTGK